MKYRRRLSRIYRETRYKTKVEEADGDAWLLTYGDLMTQLLCFFILLMFFAIMGSIQTRHKAKAETAAAVAAMAAMTADGGFTGSNSVMGEVSRSIIPEFGEPGLEKLKSDLDEEIEELDMLEHVETEIRKEGLVIILKQSDKPVFFDTADAQVKKEAYPILDHLGRLIENLPNNVRIEGHTDSRPINTFQFPSNWELSTMRATSVLRHLSKTAKIAPRRLSAAGYGHYRPIAPNNTKLGMLKNRRVEIAILRVGESSG